MGRSDIAIVVIGRNEGARLDRCLRSLPALRTIYVDAGSGDGSAARARAAGAEVIELDAAAGHSAARARNAGLDQLIAGAAPAYVQMLDGDSMLDPAWIGAAAAALDADERLGAVFGRLREADPAASVYNWLCDIEWAVPPGPATVFAGNVMLRVQAVREAGRYRAGMIAGEDPEFAIRIGAAGWHIRCLAVPMALHDAAMTRFGQWWRRSVRAGHAFAELARLHPQPAPHGYDRSLRRILLWGGAVPLVAAIGLVLAAVADRRWLAIAIAGPLLAILQLLRIALRERRHGPARALALAAFLTIGKYAEMIGLLRFHIARLRRRPPRPIDHKAP